MKTVWDPKVRGLGERAYRGVTSYVFRYRIDGRQRFITIGRKGEWTLVAARERVKELRRMVDVGRDPAGEKRERLAAATMADLAQRYLDEVLPERNKKNRKLAYMQRRVRYVETQVTKDVDEIARTLGRHSRVADIHGGDVAKMHRGFTETKGPVRANRMLGLASRMFGLSLVPAAGENKPWRNAEQGNPCKGIRKNHEEGRTRFFSQDELMRIAAAINQYGQTHRADASTDCLRLIMLTGCRPVEAQLAQWSQFEEPGVWIKPSSHTKTNKEHRLPLSPAAIELVERLRERRKPNRQWLFPGQRPGQPLHTIAHCWKNVRELAGLEKSARVYDLRHTTASIAAAAGLSLLVIGKLLGHSNAATTARYSHLHDDPVRAAVDRVGAVLGSAMNGTKGGKVVKLRTTRT
jgi:integrase